LRAAVAAQAIVAFHDKLQIHLSRQRSRKRARYSRMSCCAFSRTNDMTTR
jgi:hypothetical protein